jgi:hypothetical protein
VPSSSVVPSGSARATVTAARVPPPPGRLSTMTGSLVAAENASPTAWPTTSPAPPAASGVTILIGRVGQSCAHTADAATSSTAATPPTECQIRFIAPASRPVQPSLGAAYRICVAQPTDWVLLDWDQPRGVDTAHHHPHRAGPAGAVTPPPPGSAVPPPHAPRR